MKINAIIHQSEEGFSSFMPKLANALRDNPSIVIGPYDSLSEDYSKVSSIKKKNKIYNQFISFSSNSDSLIVPGTITYKINNKEIVCEAPIFYKGRLLYIFHKEKDNGEGDLAEKINCVYKRGDNSRNRFKFNGKDIALELCGDHGVQNTHGCDLELILTYDNRAGFWINSMNDSFNRKAVLCDGYSPKAEAYNYDINEGLGLIEGKKKKDFVSFELF